MSTRPIMTFQPDNVCVSAFTPAAPKSSCHSGASWRGSGYANCHAMNVKTRLTPQSHPLLDLEVELVWEPGELDFHAACTAGKRLQRIFVPSFQSFPPSEVKCHYHGIAPWKKAWHGTQHRRLNRQATPRARTCQLRADPLLKNIGLEWLHPSSMPSICHSHTKIAWPIFQRCPNLGRCPCAPTATSVYVHVKTRTSCEAWLVLLLDKPHWQVQACHHALKLAESLHLPGVVAVIGFQRLDASESLRALDFLELSGQFGVHRIQMLCLSNHCWTIVSKREGPNTRKYTDKQTSDM